MFCAKVTKKGSSCKHGITSGCTVDLEQYLYFLCRQHFNGQTEWTQKDFNPERRTLKLNVVDETNKKVEDNRIKLSVRRVFEVDPSETNFYCGTAKFARFTDMAEFKSTAMEMLVKPNNSNVIGFLARQGNDMFFVSRSKQVRITRAIMVSNVRKLK